MLQIDGSLGEGGGQVLRTALSLSCILKRGVKITNIRAGRGNPGLQAQHLGVCRLLSEISGAAVEGARLGSTEITFEPGIARGGDYEFDIGTAGSCTLLMQAALPVLCFAGRKSTLGITGGTHVRAAPTFEYFSDVFLPAARKFGVVADVKMLRPGFFPKGGGRVSLSVEPSRLSGVALKAEDGGEVRYAIISSLLPEHVALREGEIVGKEYPEAIGRLISAESSCPGNAVTIWKGMKGASALGERGKKAEDVAAEACKALRDEMAPGCAVDAHLADQLLIYAALACGKTEYGTSRITPHLATNAEIMRTLSKRNIMLDADDKAVRVF